MYVKKIKACLIHCIPCCFAKQLMDIIDVLTCTVIWKLEWKKQNILFMNHWIGQTLNFRR